MRKSNNINFIEKANKIHNNKYDYSKVDYTKASKKVCIICPTHGEFWQTPNKHLSGRGCSKCSGKYKMDTNDFITRAKEIHGSKYDYSKVEYINNNEKVCIICPEHGEFWQKASNHLNLKHGCPKCKGKKSSERQLKDVNTFIIEANNIHNNEYDYSKVNYIGANKKVCIICPIHGEFWQTPSAHTNLKQGCPQCGKLKINTQKRLTTEEFKQKAIYVHGDRYDYSLVEYVNYDTPIKIICPIHGEFWQTPDSHLQGKGCKMCGVSFSKNENDVREFLINSLGADNFFIGDRKTISPLELDFLIPSKNIAIEINGIKWHSEKYKNKNYHLDKTNACKKHRIGLIHIFEDEFKESKELVFNKISHILKLQQNLPKIYGRKCVIQNIQPNEAKNFLNKYHIQGYTPSTIHYGAYYYKQLIAVISCKKINNLNNNWMLTRFASDYNYVCCGICGKLFKHFIREHNPNTIKSFADRRWTIDEENNLYIQLGFKFGGYTRPDYKYFINGSIKRHHKNNFRKKDLLKKFPNDLDEHMTENEITKKLGYFKVYDCGLIRYIWNNKASN